MTPDLQAAELRDLVKTNNMDGSARRVLLAFATRIERSSGVGGDEASSRRRPIPHKGE